MLHSRILRRFVAVAGLALSTAVPAQSLVTGAYWPLPNPVPVGDVDGDGCGDYTGSTGGTAFVFSGNSGAAIAHLTRAAAANEWYGAAGDMNADGHADVVWHNAAGQIVAVSGVDGSTLHSWPLSSIGTPYGPGASYITAVGNADFDADGCDDVLLRANGQLDVRSGRTGQVIYTTTAVPFTPGFVVGDTDGDGYQDFVITEPSLQTTRIVRGPLFATTTHANTLRCQVGDVNGNGAIDFLVRTAPMMAQVCDGASGQPLGSIPIELASISGSPVAEPAGDVDGDGCQDILAKQPGNPIAPEFIGVVSGSTLAILPGSDLSPLRAVGDVDGDGRIELSTIWGRRHEWIDPALPAASRLVRRGGSGATSIGTRVRLQTRGSCALGRQAFFDSRGSLPNGLAVLVIGSALDIDLAPLGAPGNRLFANLDILLLSLADGAGVATQSFVMPVSTTLLGATVSVQAAAVDPAANAFGFVTSNAIDAHVDN